MSVFKGVVVKATLASLFPVAAKLLPTSSSSEMMKEK
ncbi:hypothetical protein M0804_005034 [Polistes exclamans]|nr:hypothetical protein M0804_005034 [Polistes exclamans]